MLQYSGESLLSSVRYRDETDEPCSILQACVECQGGNTTTYVFVFSIGLPVEGQSNDCTSQVEIVDERMSER